MKKITLDKINFLIILLIVIGIPVGKLMSYNLFLLGYIEDSFDFNHVWLLWGSNVFLLIIYLYGLIIKKFEIEIEDILIYSLLILAIISTFIAQDRSIAFWGEVNRNEGLLTLITYFLIFLNSKNIKEKKYFNYIINVLQIIAVFQVIYGLLQTYTEVGFVKHYSRPYMAMGLCANPNFYGSYMTLIGLYAATNYLLRGKVINLVLALIFFAGLCLSESTGPFLGYLMAIFLLIIWQRKKINKKSLFILGLSCCLIFNLNNWANNYLFRDSHIKYGYEDYNIKEDIKGLVSGEDLKEVNNIGSGRIGIWKCMLPVVKEYFLLGAGIDNVGVVCPEDCGMRYDKAHNVYLQMLITNGILFLIFYCALCLIIFIKGFRLVESFDIAIFIAFIGYCVQAFANISVIDVAPYFYLFLGILVFCNNKKITSNMN